MSRLDESLPDLLGDAIDQLGKLVHNEVQLARAEFSQIAARACKGAAFIAAAGLIIIPSAVVLMISLAIFLMELGFSPLTSHLSVGVVGLLGAVALVMVGVSYLKSENLKLKVTTEQLARDVATAKDLAR
jgi:GTP:adenosylcobinamide-phosphate guanylyltransferase